MEDYGRLVHPLENRVWLESLVEELTVAGRRAAEEGGGRLELLEAVDAGAATRKEVQKGLSAVCGRALSLEEFVTEFAVKTGAGVGIAGCNCKSTVIPRSGIPKGDWETKTRCFDNAKRSFTNAITFVWETITLPTVDFPAKCAAHVSAGSCREEE